MELNSDVHRGDADIKETMPTQSQVLLQHVMSRLSVSRTSNDEQKKYIIYVGMG